MHITILGPGAVGSLWATKLKLAGHSVALWSRESESSLELSPDEQTPVLFDNNNSEKLKNCDLLLVTVKAWQVKDALAKVLPQLNQDTILVFMHNGMGAVDDISAELANYPVLLATTTHGAFKPNKHSIHHTGQGATQIGAYNCKGEQCRFLVEVLNHALPKVEWADNIQTALWNKLAINCAINPLTAIEQCRNGDLADSHFESIISAVLHEIHQVLSAEYVPLSQQELNDRVYQVIRATAQNYSSMRQDIANKRRTEIDFITGHLIRTAKMHGIAVPNNLALYEQIKRLEK
ncbi:2-dehydropantoate 2-reductase [Vibrio maerlii]|uniref:2-dehydropantoate 2-reductase n=1 Tax=Vibrio maerlii TaxID=2231648 RepID=UPI000E3DBA44|nr:2-dehydropantoate 2-reductase [Vibrio maerlii]